MTEAQKILDAVAEDIQEKIDGVPGRDMPEGTITVTTIWSKTMAQTLVDSMHEVVGGNSHAVEGEEVAQLQHENGVSDEVEARR